MLIKFFVRLVHIQIYFYFFSMVNLHIVSCTNKMAAREQHLKPTERKNVLSDGPDA